MKRIIIILLALSFSSLVFAGELGLQASHITDRQSGVIMISGAGTFDTDLSSDLKSSELRLNSDIALFIMPVLALGVDIGWIQTVDEEELWDGDIDEIKISHMTLGPRAYFFFGGRHSELTPFIKGGANFRNDKIFLNDDVQDERKAELGLTASAGLLLNLAKNVGISVEAEYDFQKGEEIDTSERLFLKFGIRSFLGN